MKYIYTLLGIVLFTFQAQSQCSDLFFSEYIEGSSNNKALEIYNPTDESINLGAYKVNLYSNGSETPNGSNSITLPDTLLESGGTFIIAHASADPIILALADYTGGPANFNGDDAVELVDTLSGLTIDVIGVIGERPDPAWVVGSGSTQNHTLVRNANTNDGTDDWTAGALTWDVYDSNFFDSLGTHFVNSCAVVTPTPIISLSTVEETSSEDGGTITVTINVINITEDVTFDLVLDAASTADGADATVSPLGTIAFASGTADTSVDITIEITDDSDVEPDETIIINIENATAAATVPNTTYTLTILNDDFELNNPCADLFFSEYIEGSSNNKAIEIYNPTETAIDLGLYKINLYGNGASTAGTTFNFPGGFMLAAGDVYVIANSQADSLGIRVHADTVSNITFYNGDDALELADTTTSTTIDVIGQIGEDPGSNWPVGTGATSNYTLVRKAVINQGIPVWGASTSTWDVFPQDDFSYIGSHSIIPCEPEICETVDIIVTGLITDESSLGLEDGAIDASVSGGTGTYTYSWNNEESTEDISDLAPGEYTLAAIDGNGCVGYESFLIVEGPDPCEGVTIEITGVITDETNLGDEDGAVDISVSGGTEPYTYEWSNDSTTQDISGLTGGNYVITVTDANGCTGTTAFFVQDGVDPCDGVNIVVAGTVTNESVEDADDGSIDASATGGSGTFTYSWDNGATTEDISSLTPGDYVLTATDENGCTGTASFTVLAGAGVCDGVTITVTGSVTDESAEDADDGSIDASVSGGTGSYTYSWDNGATTEDISSLAPGDYVLTATDGNGCTGTASFTIQPADSPCNGVTIVVTGTVTDETTAGLEDGAIDATVTGGTGTYTYAWDNGATTEDISGLAPSDYTLTATDGNGCTGSATFTVAAGGTVGVNEIASLSRFSVYPNPVAQILNVDLQFNKTEQVQLQIVDVMGRTVLELQTESVLSKTYSIQPNLANGIYFLKVSVGNNTAIEPFVVQ